MFAFVEHIIEITILTFAKIIIIYFERSTGDLQRGNKSSLIFTRQCASFSKQSSNSGPFGISIHKSGLTRRQGELLAI